MFVDQVKISLKAGDGGNGITAYRREKYVPFGGPAGGDGGKGASVVFEVDEGLRTLLDFRYQRHFKAKKGENGQSSNMHGRNAEDLVLKVPPGTIIKSVESEEVLADLVEDGQRAIVARGGRGGRGNSRFATPRNPAPDFSENGEPGEELEVTLELKLLADVGLVGFPSVGKSTLLSIVSKAKPKIGAYHFTTIKPNLGVVSTPDHRSFVMADLPGLIEGASDGVGLGHQFLRHVERTKVIVHMIDMSGSEGRNPLDDYKIINQELINYKQRLEDRPQIIVANKMDLPDSQGNLSHFKEQLDNDVTVVPVSTITRDNIDQLLYQIADKLEEVKDVDFSVEEDENLGVNRVLYKHTPSTDKFTISRDDDGAYVVSGNAIERMFKMTDFNSDPAVRRFARQMRSMGIDDALRERGCSNGDIVRILGGEFEFVGIGVSKLDNKDNRKFYLIREDVLPESVIKTLKVKDALKNNSNLSIYDAVKQFNLSRSAFYKYRETIFPVDEKILDQREFTLILYVNDIVGMLAQVLNAISQLQLSVLTIHQSVPIEDKATITLSLNARNSNLSIDEVIESLREINHVTKVDLISMTM